MDVIQLLRKQLSLKESHVVALHYGIIEGRKVVGTLSMIKLQAGEQFSPAFLFLDFVMLLSDLCRIFLLLDGLMKDVSLFAARQARKAGIPVMLDAGRVREGMLELARLSDNVVGSEEFARELGWKDDTGTFKCLTLLSRTSGLKNIRHFLGSVVYR